MSRLICATLILLLAVDSDAMAGSSFGGSRSSFAGSRSGGTSLVPRSSFQRQAPVAVAPVTSARPPSASIDPGYTRRNTGPDSSFKGSAGRPVDGASLYQRYQSKAATPLPGKDDMPEYGQRKSAASYEQTAKYRRQNDYQGFNNNRSPSYPQPHESPRPRGGFSWGSAAAGAAAGFLLSSLLNQTASANDLEEYRRHYNDPAARAWREEQQQRADSDPELKRRLEELENRVQSLPASPVNDSAAPLAAVTSPVTGASQKTTRTPVARLCSGLPQGAYAMAARLLNQNLPVEVIQTSGSLENLDAVREGRCDVGFAQRDVVVTESGSILKTSSDFMLEALLLMCNNRSLPDSIASLKSGSRVAIPGGSGAEATWNILTRHLPQLRDVSVVEALTPSEAIAMAASSQADCAFLVTHPDSGILAFADLDDHLRLIPIREDDFKPLTSNPESSGLYQPVSIAGRRFKHLARSNWTDGYAIETVLLVNDDWRQNHRSEYDRVLRAISVLRTRLEGQS